MNIKWEILGDLGSILEGLAGILTLITILFVLKQTKEMVKQTRLNAISTMSALYQEIAAIMVKIDLKFTDVPKLRPYFYNSKSLAGVNEDSELYSQIMAIAEMFCDFIDLVMVMWRITQKVGDKEFYLPLREWSRYFLDVYSKSPALQLFLSKHRDWYNPDVIDLLDPNKIA